MSPLLRYCLLQIPGLVLVVTLLGWGVAQDWIGPVGATIAGLLWLLKDALLYPWYRPALEGGRALATDALIGRTAEVERALDPEGQIRVGSELWTARSEGGAHIATGRQVRILSARGLILTVAPIAEAPDTGRSGAQADARTRSEQK